MSEAPRAALAAIVDGVLAELAAETGPPRSAAGWASLRDELRDELSALALGEARGHEESPLGRARLRAAARLLCVERLLPRLLGSDLEDPLATEFVEALLQWARADGLGGPTSEPPRWAEVRFERLAARAGLTPREVQVAWLALEGAANREIAADLGIAAVTVGTHLGRVYRKFGVAGRTELSRLLVDVSPTGVSRRRSGGPLDPERVRRALV